MGKGREWDCLFMYLGQEMGFEFILVGKGRDWEYDPHSERRVLNISS